MQERTIKAPKWFKIFITHNKRPGARRSMLEAVKAEQCVDLKKLGRVVDADA